jgi:hypothetical protein
MERAEQRTHHPLVVFAIYLTAILIFGCVGALMSIWFGLQAK